MNGGKASTVRIWKVSSSASPLAIPIRAASPTMVTIAGTAVRSAVVAASQMQPTLRTARTAVESLASTLATARATIAKPRVVAARNAYWRSDPSVIAR